MCRQPPAEHLVARGRGRIHDDLTEEHLQALARRIDQELPGGGVDCVNDASAHGEGHTTDAMPAGGTRRRLQRQP